VGLNGSPMRVNPIGHHPMAMRLGRLLQAELATIAAWSPMSSVWGLRGTGSRSIFEAIRRRRLA
jgi:hypothetical protein